MRFPSTQELTEEERVWSDGDRMSGMSEPSPDPWEAWVYRERTRTLLRAVDRYVPRPAPILDAGCAQGTIALLLAERGYTVTGVDISPAAISYARKKWTHGAFETVVANFAAWRPSARYTCVILGEILEHVAWPERFLDHARSFLVPGGWVIVTTPNGEFVRNRLPTLSTVGDRRALELHQYGPAHHHHLFLLTRKELRRLFHDAGFTIVEEHYVTSYLVRLWMKIPHLPVPQRFLERTSALSLRFPALARVLGHGHVIVGRVSSA